jgi:hypothetical protein
MNANGLARQYDKLTPWERLPLLVAAGARGDEAESDRLARSAPRECFRLPDYHGQGEGLLLVSLFHLVELLRLTALYRQMEGILEQEDEPESSRTWATVRLTAYLLVCNFDGWRMFCKERALDPEVLLRDTPGYTVAVQAEETARAVALSVEEATAWARQRDGEAEPVGILTAECVADGIRRFVENRAQFWS